MEYHASTQRRFGGLQGNVTPAGAIKIAVSPGDGRASTEESGLSAEVQRGFFDYVVKNFFYFFWFLMAEPEDDD